MLRLVATVVALSSALLLTPRRASADTSDEAVEKITQLNKDAITAYQAKKYEDARKILKQALDLASSSGLDNHPIKARTHIHMGVVIIVGFNQRDLGIKQFKKAIEIQADINLTKSLVTPDLSAAFAEAKGAGGAQPPGAGQEPGAPASTPATTPSSAPPEAKPAAPATPPPAAKPAEPEVPSNGLTHEAVTEAQQGSAISITVEVGSDLQFDKLVLAYRPDGAAEFLGREMKQVSEGEYGAEIPTTATGGSIVAYYIEAEDAEGGPVAARGSVDNPLVIHLAGVGARHHEADEDEEDEEPDNRFYAGLMLGGGIGWASGNGDTNHDISINPAGLAPAGVGQISPEFGYWLSSTLLLSFQLRYEVVSGTNGIYCAGMTTPAGSCASNPTGVYKTANYALAGFGRATWMFGDSSLHPFFSLAAGIGSIRHTVDFHRVASANDCGVMHNEACKDTIGGGWLLVGPGTGLLYELGDRVSLVAQLNATLGFPTNFTFNFDINAGVAFGF
jgi:hypothetical protein